MLENKIEAAFDAAHSEYPLGHLKGEQIKNHLRLAMAQINIDKAMLLAGKINHHPKGAMKAKAFPADLLVPEVANFQQAANTDEVVQVAANDSDIVTDIVNMKPATAVERFGIETIDAMIATFQIDADGMNANQKAAALIQFLKKQSKKKA